MTRPERARARAVALVTLGVMVAIGARASDGAAEDANTHFRRALAFATDARDAGFFRQPLLARRMVSELQRTIALAPNHVRAHEELARFYLSAPWFIGGSLDKVRGEMSSLRPIAPERVLVLNGWIAHHEGRMRAAEQSFRAAVAQYPDSTAAYLALGHLLRDEGRNDDAFAAFARVAALTPDNRLALYQIGLIGATTGTHLEAAEAAMLRYMALGISGGEASPVAVHRWMGMIYSKLGKVGQARVEYTRTLELRPGDGEARAGMRALK